ncbi:TPR-like protein [Rickenella mellea]|uniref:TPR-like protein n=1 Tax=Rickenella mellea TaxID=50990 RepID=A0A4Y7Q9J9_9AGAM|nr:TPR-like protein [Rickenella mellea]
MSTSMVYLTSDHIPDGYYKIKNYTFGNLVGRRLRDKELCGSFPAVRGNNVVWHITRRSHGKHLIRSVTDGLVAQCAPVPKEKGSIYVDREAFDWDIEQVSPVQPDCYLIFSSVKPRLVWGLRDEQDGTWVVFTDYMSNGRLWWRFEKATDAEIEDIDLTNKLGAASSQPYGQPSSILNDLSNQENYMSELKYEPPPFPSCLFGRDDFITSAVQLILQHPPARLAILGPGGIGKTTVAAAIFGCDDIKKIFTQHKAFTSCESLFMADQLVVNLCHCFQLTIQEKRPLKTLQSFLQGVPKALLVLDNFETVWNGDHESTLRLLQILDSYRHLTILITLRGALLPDGIIWTKPTLKPLQTLTVSAAKEIYRTISSTDDDKDLEKLMQNVDFLPLAIVLLAYLGKLNMSPSKLLSMWQDEQTALLRKQGGSKSDCLETSITLSLQSPLMKESKYTLKMLRIICYLPAGVKLDDLSQFASISRIDALKAIEILLKTGLVQQSEKKRLKVLSPVRYFILKQHACDIAEVSEIKQKYFNIIKNIKNIFTWVPSEVQHYLSLANEENDNIFYILNLCLDECSKDADIFNTVISYSQFLYFTIPSTALIQKAIAMYNLLCMNDKSGAAECLLSLGNIARTLQSYPEAISALKEAHAEFQQTGNKKSAAHCLKSLGDIATMTYKYLEGISALKEAQIEFEQVGDKRGVAQCLHSLGNIATMVNMHAEAALALEDAQAIFQHIGDRLGVAYCLKGLGDIAIMLSKHSEAMSILKEAQTVFQQIGDKLGVAQCLQSLGDNFRILHSYSEAISSLKEAQFEFQQIGYKLGVAHCLKSLSDIATMQSNYSEAISALTEGQAVLKQIDDKIGVAYCFKKQADIAVMLKNYPEAVSALKEAQAIFQNADDKLGVAHCLKKLADIAAMLKNYPEAISALKEAQIEFQKIENTADAEYCLSKIEEIGQLLTTVHIEIQQEERPAKAKGKF